MPDPTKPADGQQDSTTVVVTGGEPPKPEASQTLTQSQIDAIVEDRLRRQREKYADYDDLKAKAAAKDAQDAAAKTELQQAHDRATKAEDAAKAATTRINATIRHGAIVAEAAAQDASNPGMVAAILAGSGEITVSDVGEVSGAKAAIEKLLKGSPELKKGIQAGTSGAPFTGGEAKSLDELIKAAEAAKDWKESVRLKAAKAAMQA